MTQRIITSFCTSFTLGSSSKRYDAVSRSHDADMGALGPSRRDHETEDEASLASLPPAVKAGLTKGAGKGTFEKVETLTKNGQLVAYEAAVKTSTKRSEIQVGPDDKKLAHPE